jgi:predicted esterase
MIRGGMPHKRRFFGDRLPGRAFPDKGLSRELPRKPGLITLLPLFAAFLLLFPAACTPQGDRLPHRSRSDSPVAEQKRSATHTEKLTGYKIPAEYLIFSSKYFPDGMAAVALPADYEKRPGKEYPLVIAFGGAGECVKPPRKGALAWIDDYALDHAVHALEDNRLEADDFRGLVTEHRLKAFNRSLKQSPYRGVIVVCPYSPPLTVRNGLESPAYESFVMKELIPELQRRYRVAQGRIGVDGVSMGGARSMYYGFKYPKVFSSIGSLQGAFGPFREVYRGLVKRNARILRKKRIQLVTSDGDPMARDVKAMHELLSASKVPHRFFVLSGPHDYIFNRGPGSLALLVFHNRSL